jgi:serine/threonine protein kinase
MALSCFSGLVQLFRAKDKNRVVELLDAKDKIRSPFMFEEETAESLAGSTCTSCASSRSAAQNDMTDMSTVDTLPELDFSKQNSMKDWSLTVEEQVKLFQDASIVQPWAPERFEMVRKLQEAPRNKGAVDLMRDIARGGCFVAVKRMPLNWTCTGPTEFKEQHSTAMENPWVDAGVTAFLHSIGYTYVCDPVGVFRDSSYTYMIGTYATKGDMFSWIQDGKKPGTAREKMVRPIVEQVFEAVRCLHACGIAHRDISLENLLLTHEEGQESGTLQVKLVDFGAASLTRMSSGKCGKPSYAAPEVFESGEYDGFLSDTFSVGVVLFTLAACGYPWLSTHPGNCKMFTYVSKNGLRAYLRARKTGGSKGTPLAECLSQPLVALLEGLVAINPADRFTLGKAWDVITGSATSVWDSEWLKDSA